MSETATNTATDGQATPIVMRYFGHATYDDYHAAASRRGHALEGLTRDQAWKQMMARLNVNKPHISSAEWIRDELDQNPNYRTRPVWYWVMPETRALVPLDLLAVVDSCGAGIA